jgi:hypothetical protein
MTAEQTKTRAPNRTRNFFIFLFSFAKRVVQQAICARDYH